MNLLDAVQRISRGCLNNRRGQTIIEYSLIIVLIAIVIMAMLTGVGSNSNKAFSTINSTLS